MIRNKFLCRVCVQYVDHKCEVCEQCIQKARLIRRVCDEVRRTIRGCEELSDLDIVKGLWEKVWQLRRS